MYKLILLMVGVLYGSGAFATHVAGGYIEYTCLGSNQYRVDIRAFYDCSGISAATTANLLVTSSACGTPTSLNFTAPLVGGLVEYVYCPGIGTTCTSPSGAPGYNTGTYTTVITLPFQCDDWVLSTSFNARNITDWTPASNTTTMLLTSGINNVGGLCNSSPRFSDNNFILGCAGNPAVFVQQISDPDGDMYEVTPTNPLSLLGGGIVGNLAYQAPQSFTYPYPSTTGNAATTIDGVTSFTPPFIGTSIMAFLIEEFDAAGNLVGWVKREVQIVILPNCLNPPPTISLVGGPLVVEQGGEICFDVVITGDVGEQITNESLSGLSGATINTVQAGHITTFNVCFTEPGEDCFDQTYEFTVEGFDDGCPNTGVANATYQIFSPRIEFCEDSSYFTDRSLANGNPVPLFNRAALEIWVGDNMPVESGIPLALQDTVEIHNEVTFAAGVGVNIPSCVTGTGCVTFTAPLDGSDIHLLVEPQNCNPMCPEIPLSLNTSGKFECHGEYIHSEVSGGTGPYTYEVYWQPGGNASFPNGTFLGTGLSHTGQFDFDVHNQVSILPANIPFFVDGSKFFYRIVVTDAAGQRIVDNGETLGTRSFYVPLSKNMTDNEQPNFGLHRYAQSAALTDGFPFAIWDGQIFLSDPDTWDPPYYGATKITWRVFTNVSQVIHFQEEKVTEDDWSIDNFSLWWNGHFMNDLNEPCSPTDVYAYQIEAENCTAVPELYTNHVTLLECYEDDFTPFIVTAMPTLLEEYNGVNGAQGKDDVDDGLSVGIDNENTPNSLDISVFPNPTNDRINIIYSNANVKQINVLDARGKQVWSVQNELPLSINFSSFESGLYFIEFRYTDKKIIKKVTKR